MIRQADSIENRTIQQPCFVIDAGSGEDRAVFYLTKDELRRFLDELEYQWQSPNDVIVVADVKMQRAEALELRGTFRRWLAPPARDWGRYGF